MGTYNTYPDTGRIPFVFLNGLFSKKNKLRVCGAWIERTLQKCGGVDFAMKG